MRTETRKNINQLFNQVEMHITLVKHYGYEYPSGQGEDYLWSQALCAAKALLDMLPPYPPWHTQDSDVWTAPDFWQHDMADSD
jgi:hypothetical protein